MLTADDIRGLRMRVKLFADGGGRKPTDLRHMQVHQCVEHPCLTKTWKQMGDRSTSTVFHVGETEISAAGSDLLERIAVALNEYYERNPPQEKTNVEA
jgi:hypothetical protein